MNVLVIVYICALRKNNEPLLPAEGTIKCTHIHGTIANSQMMPTKISKNGAIAKVTISLEQVIL